MLFEKLHTGNKVSSMVDAVEYNTFEEVATMIASQGGASGRELARRLAPFLDNAEGDYTVYWPRDSIRLYESGSFEMALFFRALLLDARTTWYMSSVTEYGKPEISRVRRRITEAQPRANLEAVKRGRIFKQDRLLAFDIWFHQDDTEPRFQREDEPHHKLDCSTIPL